MLYALNSPTRYMDPLGLQGTIPIPGITPFGPIPLPNPIDGISDPISEGVAELGSAIGEKIAERARQIAIGTEIMQGLIANPTAWSGLECSAGVREICTFKFADYTDFTCSYSCPSAATFKITP